MVQSAVMVVLVVVSMSTELVISSSFRECVLGTPPLYATGGSCGRGNKICGEGQYFKYRAKEKAASVTHSPHNSLSQGRS